LLDRHLVPEKILKDECDWTDKPGINTGFFKYQGSWYNLAQFMKLNSEHEWDGSHHDSMSTAVLVKLSRGEPSYGEHVKVGRYINHD